MGNNASDKTPKNKTKIADIQPPKAVKSAAADATNSQKLSIQSRSVIDTTPAVTNSDAVPPQETPTPPAAKRTVIKPITLTAADTPTPNVATNTANGEPVSKAAAAREAAANGATIAEPVAPTKPSTQAQPEPAKAVEKPQVTPSPAQPTETENTEVEANADEIQNEGEPKQPTEATKQAVKEAEAEAKRQAELQSMIESKEYYVPINAVAQKRSIKVSFGLTFLLLLLSIALIDLMLDSGVIDLIQKLPHTHFFNLTY